MTAWTSSNGGRSLPAQAAAWRIDPSSTTFELTVYHDFGPIRITKTFRRADGLLQRDQAGNFRLAFAIDAATLEATPDDADPRRRSHKLFPGPQATHPPRCSNPHA